MKTKKHKVILYFYNRFQDPLIQGNIFQYIYNLTNDPDACPYHFVVITYEDPLLPIPHEELKKIEADLVRRRIIWKPVRWHAGTSIFRKGTDFFAALKLFNSLRLQGYNHIVSLGTVAGSFAYLVALFFRMELFLYQYEPHSEFAMESALSPAARRNFKILQAIERRSAFYAKVISTGTVYMMQRLEKWQVKAPVYRIPSVTNDERFQIDLKSRERIRSGLNISSEKKVFIYAGKFGGLYYGIEVVQVMKWLSESIPHIFFIILTPQDRSLVEGYIEQVGLAKELYYLGAASYSEMPGILSAADFGLVNIPPTPSQKFRSPIKVGEYLCCGLPYLVCKGVSEDDPYAIEKNVGVVVDNFSEECIQKAKPKIQMLLDEPGDELKQRCREAGVAYRGLSKLQGVFEEAMQTLTT